MTVIKNKKLSPVEQRKLNESLMDAALYGLIEDVRKAIENGADVDARDEIDNTALVWAASNNNVAIVDLLLKNGANVNARNSIGWTPLISASNNGNTETVKLLVEYKVDTNARDGGGLTALMSSCLKDHTEIVKILLEANTEPNAEDADGRTALFYALESDPTEIVKQQLERGEKSNPAQTLDMNSAKISIMEMLLNKNARVNSVDKERNTPLILAVKKGNSAAVRLLLSRGAKIEMKNDTGLNVLEIAADENQLEIERILMEHLAKTTEDEESVFLENINRIEETNNVVKTLNERLEDKFAQGETITLESKEEKTGDEKMTEQLKQTSENTDPTFSKKEMSEYKFEMPLKETQNEKSLQKPVQEEKEQSHDTKVKTVYVRRDIALDRDISEEERTFLNNLPPSIVKGYVSTITDNEIILDVSLKAQCRIPISEFDLFSSIKIDDEILTYVESIEKGGLKIDISKKKADFIINYERIKKAYDENLTVKGHIKKKSGNSFIVFVMDIQAILPVRELDIKPLDNSEELVGKEDRFKIISIDSNNYTITISRKRVIEAEIEERKRKLKEKIQIEAEFTGEVKRIVDYGAYVDLGGIEGLLHISDMPAELNATPDNMFKPGEKIKVKVIGYDQFEDVLYLALKQDSPMSWDYIKSKFPVRSRTKGKVVNLANYGAFIELEPGIEGMVHISEMSWTKKVNHPSQIVSVGDQVDVMVLSISSDAKQIGLSIKQLITNPWLDIDQRVPIGSKIKKKIRSISSFGIFVELENDIDGLVHISDVCWTNCEFDPASIYSVGEEVEAVVLTIDKPFHRVALGIKQGIVDPWVSFNDEIKEGDEVDAEIIKLTKEGIIVKVPAENTELTAFVPRLEMALEMMENPSEAFIVGENVKLAVTQISKQDRIFTLSFSQYFEKKNPSELDKFVKERSSKKL